MDLREAANERRIAELVRNRLARWTSVKQQPTAQAHEKPAYQCEIAKEDKEVKDDQAKARAAELLEQRVQKFLDELADNLMDKSTAKPTDE